MNNISPFVFNVIRGNSNYEINYHYYNKKSRLIKDTFIAVGCSSWVDAVNQLNQYLFQIGFPIYCIDSFQEKVNF